MLQDTSRSLKQTALLFLLMIAVLLLAAAAPAFGQDSATQDIISPEEAIAIAAFGQTGPNDFRISDAGNEANYAVSEVEAAFNPKKNEYLVVWSGKDNGTGISPDEHEIYGQRIDAATGLEVGANDFRISDMAPPTGNQIYAKEPAVAYNVATDRYLVVWSGIDDPSAVASKPFDIFGRLLDGEGNPLTADDVRISPARTEDGDAALSAARPHVTANRLTGEFLVVWNLNGKLFGQIIKPVGTTLLANPFSISNIASTEYATVHNPQTNQYLVTWSGRTAASEPFDVYGQLLDAIGNPQGTKEFRISDMGPDVSPGAGTRRPSIAYNAVDNRFLVIWMAKRVFDEHRVIFGQLLAANGAEVGENDFRITEPNEQIGVEHPTVVHNELTNQYLVVWNSFFDNPGENGNNFEALEVFGRLLDNEGRPTGPGEFQISQFGADMLDAYRALRPAVAVDSLSNRYLVAWHGNDERRGLAPFEDEAYGQLLSAEGVEIGVDDMRLSDMGVDRTANAEWPAVAYNSTDNEYLVVWSADATSGLSDEEFEIFGQRVDALTGREVGVNDFRISIMGPSHDTRFQATTPAVTYNSKHNEYLVVWQADHDADGQVDDEFEIFGRKIGANGKLGEKTVRISRMGLDGDPDYDALDPDVVYNPIDDRYFVTWWANNNFIGMAKFKYEVYSQELSTELEPFGSRLRVSRMGADVNSDAFAMQPRAAHDPTLNQYLVVWSGADDTAGLAPNELEVFGGFVNLNSPGHSAGRFRISEAGPDGDQFVDARRPDVAFNPALNQYLVVWAANDVNAGLPPQKIEVFGQLLDAGGQQIGDNDFKISATGKLDRGSERAEEPAVSYDPQNQGYVVVWHVLQAFVDPDAEEPEFEREIAGQQLKADGTSVFPADLRISNMGPAGNAGFTATFPAIACGAAGPSCLVTWEGDDDEGTLVRGEKEIFGQLLGENTSPIAVPDVYTTTQDSLLSITAPGVLQNDQAADVDVLTAHLDTPPLIGDLLLLENGAFNYTPQADFVGTVIFSYFVTDGFEKSKPATVSIEVLPAQGEPLPDPDPEPGPLVHVQLLPCFGYGN